MDENLPRLVMADVSWRFDGSRFADREGFSAAVRAAQGEAPEETSCWEPSRLIVPRPRIRVHYSGVDATVPDSYVERSVLIVSDGEPTLSAEELLFKLHNAVVDELKEVDHRYFEGLVLRGVGRDGVPEYEMRQGS